MNSFYGEEELAQIDLKEYGKNVLISKKVSIYSPEKMKNGNHVHIATYAVLFAGAAGIVCEEYVGISARTIVYATSDDYSGEYMTNPTITDEYKNIHAGKVLLKKHALVGARV